MLWLDVAHFFLRSRRLHRVLLLLPLVILGSRISISYQFSNEVRFATFAFVSQVPILAMVVNLRGGSDPIESTLPKPILQFETLIVLSLALAASVAAGLAHIGAQGSERTVDQITWQDWSGNIAGATGVTLLSAAILGPGLSWIPCTAWLVLAVIGARPGILDMLQLPEGVFWWPITGIHDQAALRFEIAILLIGALLYPVLPSMRKGVQRTYLRRRIFHS